MQAPKYKFYATLFDSYQYMMESESDTAFQEFIDKLNRVPFISEAADKGTAFNELVDHLAAGELEELEGKLTLETVRKKEVYVYNYTSREGIAYRFEFKQEIVDEFVRTYKGAVTQIRCSAIIETAYGPVEVYGNLDELLFDMISDIKTTKSYTFPKYLNNSQHLVYPYYFYMQGVEIPFFRYHVTDFSNIYNEDYYYVPERDIPRLRYKCEDLIRFVEQHRHLIIDKKLFALEEEEPNEEIPA